MHPTHTHARARSLEGFVAYVRKGRSDKERPDTAAALEGFDALEAEVRACV